VILNLLLCTANTLRNTNKVRKSNGWLPQMDSVAQRMGSLFHCWGLRPPMTTSQFYSLRDLECDGDSNKRTCYVQAEAACGEYTTASPITPRHEVEPSDHELDSLHSHKPHSRLQVLHPSSADHWLSTPPTPTLETVTTGATMENSYRASVWSDSFMAAQESPLRTAQETILKSKSLMAPMSVPAPAPAPRPKGVPQPI